MQKLQLKLKNVPTDVKSFLVCSSTNSVLNKQETVSEQSKVLDCNNSEGIQRLSQTSGFKTKVFVLSVRGKPLMPCTPAKARHLLEEGKAKVVKRIPFTIQLNFECENKTQSINLGIDTGYGNIGLSAVTKKDELISGTLKLDGKTKERLDTKRMYRKNRRNRLWYREPRWKNRKRKEGWLPPSIQRRYDTHLNLINRLKKLLPITQVIVEVAKFDIQKIINPNIEGKEYQQGNSYEYQNVRGYLMSREKGLCQLCKKDFKGQSSHIHHIKPKSQGGNNRVDNLAILHEKCHTDLHKKHLESKLKSNSRDYKHSTFMNIVHKRFWNDVSNLIVTYGNITFVNRNKLGLEKSHNNDAFVIADGDGQNRVEPFEITQKHRHNRKLQVNRKGYKPSIKSHIYKMQPKDLVWRMNKIYKVISVQNKGGYVKVENLKKVLKCENIQKIYTFGGLVWNI